MKNEFFGGKSEKQQKTLLLFGGPSTQNKERLNCSTLKKQPSKENVAIKRRE